MKHCECVSEIVSLPCIAAVIVDADVWGWRGALRGSGKLRRGIMMSGRPSSVRSVLFWLGVRVGGSHLQSSGQNPFSEVKAQ